MSLSGKRLPLLLLALLATLALIVTGCGGDGDDNGSTTAAAETETSATQGGDGASEADGGDSEQPSTDKDFIAAVTDICEQAQKDSEAAGINDEPEIDENSDPDDFANELIDRFDKIKAIFNGAIDDLGEIAPPAGKKSDYEEFLTTNKRLMELSEEAISAFAKDPEHVMSEKDMQEQQKLGENYERLLGELGIPGGCFNDA